ncbi:MAG: hypothetical protein K6T74_08375 [Geminicoccaceae bacterium]|nr:hypothetical protein [Geminicoccaceae bacterium]
MATFHRVGRPGFFFGVLAARGGSRSGRADREGGVSERGGDPRRIAIFGASSAIAEATARLWAVRGAHFFLVARDADRLADALGLARSARAGHSERDALAELATWLALVAGSLGKLGADVAILAQDEVGELVIEGGGGSSAMPGKVNPIAAEILVALARYATTLASGVQHALVHENERSGRAWTLEWLLVPQLCVATGASTRLAARLLASLRLPSAAAKS